MQEMRYKYRTRKNEGTIQKGTMLLLS